MTRAACSVIAVLAVLISAWFVIGIRQAHDLAGATALVSGRRAPAPAAASRARSLLDGAGWLNPDRQVDLVRARLDVELGAYAAARRVIDRVLQAEPQNAQAWLALAQSSRGDPQAFFRAVIELRALIPRVR